ncbi:MAG: ParB/RepB/Spo0J family partition protein, partial [Geminicoccaceae bacterium]
MTDLGQEAKGSGRKRGLGRGLSSLIPETSTEVGPGHDHSGSSIPVDMLKPSPFQPRRRFSDDELEGLADSIRSKGVMQPLLVRASGRHAGEYEIIAGERRWRAAQRAGIHELPVIIRDLSDRETLE